jgi:hypothetical protein
MDHEPTRAELHLRLWHYAQEQPVRLGDAVESVLAGIGITPDRYAAAKEFFGLPPNCGCAARKEWLNKVSDWWNKEKT